MSFLHSQIGNKFYLFCLVEIKSDANLTPKILGWLGQTLDRHIISQILLAAKQFTWYVGSQTNAKYVVKNCSCDGQDRMDREWSFLSRLKCSGLSCVSYPVFCDNSGRIAVFSFLSGKKLSASSISLADIINASSFIVKVARVDADGLPDAKDAHFSLEAHVRSVEGRVSALEVASRSRPNKDEFKDFVANELRPF